MGEGKPRSSMDVPISLILFGSFDMAVKMILISVIMPFQYTEKQQEALDHIKQFIVCPYDKTNTDTYLCTLAGCAGTGKTTLTREIVKMVRKSGKQVLCVAPTHKARRVLSRIINTSSFLRIPTSTIAGLLGKIRAHGYIGTQNYKKGMDSKIGMYDFFVIDEISMVTTKDYQEICGLASEFQKKIVFVGDHLQIPHPSQKFQEREDKGVKYLEKLINPAFSKPYQLRLTEIVRTDSENPLMGLLNKVRDSIGQGFLFKHLADRQVNLLCNDNPMKHRGYLLIEDQSKFNTLMRLNAPFFKEGYGRVVSYTNHSVHQYNKLIRTALEYTDSVVKGEILMGYNNVGPGQDLIIENGQDYVVQGIEETYSMSISANGKTYEDLVGKLLTIKEHLPPTSTSTSASAEPVPDLVELQVFVLDLTDSSNDQILEELVDLAAKVNRKKSSKQDYRNYISLKAQLVFMEHLYKYKGGIYTGSEFKQLHPLLFTKTTTVLSCKRHTITDAAEIVSKLESLYPALLCDRLQDDKDISSNEVFADMYQILEKDIDYGYAITSHKSQGSTYHTVFIDETDFNALRDGWSWTKKLAIRRSMERDQLKYVALSRSSNIAYILASQT
jgi:hypothetical protein